MIQGVEVLGGIEGISGKNQLRTLFDFLSRIEHQNKVLFVFDSDVNFNLNATNQTYPFTFDVNSSNMIAERGIENLFKEELFDNFSTTITNSRGVKTRKFDPSRKNDFLEFVLQRHNPDDFKNFDLLLERIQELLVE